MGQLPPHQPTAPPSPALTVILVHRGEDDAPDVQVQPHADCVRGDKDTSSPPRGGSRWRLLAPRHIFHHRCPHSRSVHIREGTPSGGGGRPSRWGGRPSGGGGTPSEGGGRPGGRGGRPSVGGGRPIEHGGLLAAGARRQRPVHDGALMTRPPQHLPLEPVYRTAGRAGGKKGWNGVVKRLIGWGRSV